MSGNPFDELDRLFLVLVNEVGQHSLWPVFAEIPRGWQEAHGPAAKADCAAYVEANWTDLGLGNPHINAE